MSEKIPKTGFGTGDAGHIESLRGKEGADALTAEQKTVREFASNTLQNTQAHRFEGGMGKRQVVLEKNVSYRTIFSRAVQGKVLSSLSAWAGIIYRRSGIKMRMDLMKLDGLVSGKNHRELESFLTKLSQSGDYTPQELQLMIVGHRRSARQLSNLEYARDRAAEYGWDKNDPRTEIVTVLERFSNQKAAPKFDLKAEREKYASYRKAVEEKNLNQNMVKAIRGEDGRSLNHRLEELKQQVSQYGPGLLHQKDENGILPLQHAMQLGNHEMVEWLLKNGANANEIPLAFNPLYNAVRSGDLALVKVLLTTGNMDPNVQNLYGETPLHEAAYLVSGEREAMINLLLEHGAISFINNDGQSPVDLVRLMHGEEAADKLTDVILQRSPSQEVNRKTKLNRAILEGDFETVKKLVNMNPLLETLEETEEPLKELPPQTTSEEMIGIPEKPEDSEKAETPPFKSADEAQFEDYLALFTSDDETIKKTRAEEEPLIPTPMGYESRTELEEAKEYILNDLAQDFGTEEAKLKFKTILPDERRALRDDSQFIVQLIETHEPQVFNYVLRKIDFSLSFSKELDSDFQEFLSGKLEKAVREGDKNTLVAFIERGADLRNFNISETVLEKAYSDGDVDVRKILRKGGVDFDTKLLADEFIEAVKILFQGGVETYEAFRSDYGVIDKLHELHINIMKNKHKQTIVAAIEEVSGDKIESLIEKKKAEFLEENPSAVQLLIKDVLECLRRIEFQKATYRAEEITEQNVNIQLGKIYTDIEILKDLGKIDVLDITFSDPINENENHNLKEEVLKAAYGYRDVKELLR